MGYCIKDWETGIGDPAPPFTSGSRRSQEIPQSGQPRDKCLRCKNLRAEILDEMEPLWNSCVESFAKLDGDIVGLTVAILMGSTRDPGYFEIALVMKSHRRLPPHPLAEKWTSHYMLRGPGRCVSHVKSSLATH